jgi:hypothetical protein
MHVRESSSQNTLILTLELMLAATLQFWDYYHMLSIPKFTGMITVRSSALQSRIFRGFTNSAEQIRN